MKTIEALVTELEDAERCHKEAIELYVKNPSPSTLEQMDARVVEIKKLADEICVVRVG